MRAAGHGAVVSAYYNEIDPYAAQWLRNLIAAGHIADGEVDERSIVDVSPDDLRGFTQCHFFAGIAGWSYALRLAGWPDDRPVWTGSCPCQPLSRAGQRKGHADERHLWPAFYRLIEECGPAIVFGEQVNGNDGREWVSGVFADLETAGYACGAAGLLACLKGSPHQRPRLYWVADSNGSGWDAGHTESPRLGHRDSTQPGSDRGFWDHFESHEGDDGSIRRFGPGAFPVAHGVPQRVAKLRAIGNAIVPQVASAFIKAVMS